jgi:cytoplasmic iron level regulating protein YaaA (DUF328/UPF0246 family)
MALTLGSGLVIVLLPPSEGKHEPTRGRPLDLDRLVLPELRPTRERVLDALAAVSARPDAPRELGVSPRLADQIARNLTLRTDPTAPAEQVYTGVLYAALDLGTLDPSSRRRAARRLLVVSALFGALRMGDHIPAYRLAMGVDLPPLGPLARLWRPPLAAALPAVVGRGLVLDCRSSAYAAAWTPPPELAPRWVTVQVPGQSHLAKHTRGLVARAVCASPQAPDHPVDLVELLRPLFDVSLESPPTTGRSWRLDVTVRAGGRSG